MNPSFPRILRIVAVLAVLVPSHFGCATEPQDLLPGRLPAGVAVDIAENVSIDVREVEGELHTVFHFSQTLNDPPTSGRVNFPSGFFDGFADGGIKSAFGLVGVFSFNQQVGLPLQLVDNTHATINAFPPVNFEVQANSMLLTTNSASQVGSGSYAFSFLPGVFNLNPGAYDLEMVATWPDTSTFTFHKLLLVSAAVVPHLGIGLAGEIGVGSVFVVNNAGPSDITVTAQLFRSDGTALVVEVENVAGSQFDLEVPAHDARILVMDPVGEGTLETGWARLQGTGPFQASVFFQNSDADDDDIRTGAGIAAGPLATLHVLPAAKLVFNGINTAFAICNPTSATAKVKLILRGPPEVEREIEIPSNTQMAVFIDDFFDLVGIEELITSLTIYSDTDLAVMALITLNGEQIASLPSGTSF